MSIGHGVVGAIHSREYGVKANNRHNLRILRKIVRQGNTTYKGTWTWASKTNISCTSQKIFCDNCRTCFQMCGYGGAPRLLYRLPAVSKLHKIEDSILCDLTMKNLPNHVVPHFLALTRDNWLHVKNVETGKTLESIYLSSSYNYRHIMPETEESTIVIKSTLNSNKDIGQQQSSILCAFIFMRVIPFEYIGTVEIFKSIFGNSITDALATDGLLIIFHPRGITRVYNLNYILDKCRQNDEQPHHSKSFPTTGQSSSGLPINIHIKETPPLLLEIQCADNDLQIGGYPWQYIIQPMRQVGTFQVFAVCPPHDIVDSIMKYSCNHIEPDRAIFHPDDSGRIIHYSCSELRILKVVESENPNQRLKLQFLFTLPMPHKAHKDIVTHTSSGRKVKSTSDLRNATTSTHCLISFNYEDELDIIYLLVADLTSSNRNGLISSGVYLYDNQSGQLIKIIKLLDISDDCAQQQIYLDRDVLIHTFKGSSSKYCCHVYHLRRDRDK